eukprot:358897-Chlamydomonas_euryale.AAC.7
MGSTNDDVRRCCLWQPLRHRRRRLVLRIEQVKAWKICHNCCATSPLTNESGFSARQVDAIQLRGRAAPTLLTAACAPAASGAAASASMPGQRQSSAAPGSWPGAPAPTSGQHGSGACPTQHAPTHSSAVSMQCSTAGPDGVPSQSPSISSATQQARGGTTSRSKQTCLHAVNGFLQYNPNRCAGADIGRSSDSPPPAKPSWQADARCPGHLSTRTSTPSNT